ncbi:MAG TPA: hypothetical protein VMZ53_23360 [Kofleriaceae bacterium]|nr:hypothetical protein [Kofleriaceae bacterium]
MRLWGTLVVLLLSTRAFAQPADPAPAADPQAPQQAPQPAPQPDAVPAEPPEPIETPTATEAPTSGLRVHILSTGNTYLPMTFDVFSVETKQVVASGAGAVESRGEEAPILELKAGNYKIVRSGESFDARVDYAVATVVADTVVDYVIVVDPDDFAFRGSGPLVGELPKGVEIAGVRLSLNGGGTVLFTQVRNGVGTTSGTTAQLGLFGNFGLVIEKGVHFIDVNADAKLDLFDPVTGSLVPMHDRFQASGLYAYHLENSFLGPYVRMGMVTHVFPGYVYLERDQPGTIIVEHVDGTETSRSFGQKADPDDLRIQVAKPFAPLKLQEELGANIKAVDIDLLVVKVNVGTRVGFGFRQGIMNGLIVARSHGDADPIIRFREVDDYTTLGPVIGANASVTFARWLFGSAQFGLLAPLTSTDSSQSDNFGGRLLMDFSGTAGFKVPILTNLVTASADYSFRLERDAFITARTQFEHALMARANITLF